MSEPAGAPPPVRRVAVVGLGSMGLGMARSLARAGLDVVGCDRAPAARERFAAGGAPAVATVDEVPDDREAVVCVVVDAAQTEAVLFGEGGAGGSRGLAARLPAGGVVLACATVPPAFAASAAARAAALGLHYVDAPVSGGAAKAEAGALSVMASGSEAAFARAAPLLDALAERVHRVGAEPGRGSAMKMINQLLAGVHIAAAAEAMAMAVKVGLDPRQVYEVICGSAGMSWMFENRVPRILSGDYRPHSAVDIFTKDLGIVLDTARAERFPTPLSATAHQLFTMAASAGMGRLDDSAVARVYERLSDIELPGPDADPGPDG